MTSLFIFHRDFHIQDNLGLKKCLENSKIVYLAFIFTPQQIDRNDYFSKKSFTFMLGALKELSQNVKISFFYEDNLKCLSRLLKELKITDLWENKDFSPFARARQDSNQKMCDKLHVTYHLEDTITLLPMGSVLNGKNTAYLKFTPFYNATKSFRVPEPVAISKTKINTKALKNEIKLESFTEYNFVLNGRSEALKLLKSFEKIQGKYEKNREFPYLDNTSYLGPHLHFCTMSPREIYHAIGNTTFRKQLFWREFYMYIVNYVSTDYSKKSFTLPKMNNIKWSTSPKLLKKWQQGQTGIPLVDAGMRQMLETGYMHNRLRMVVAMYLIFYLNIHWKEGEKWFAKNLKDYSYANNYGGWVWCAGIEVHSNPYFRVFSMEEQNKKIDKDCLYIKKWVPELKDTPIPEIYKKYEGLKEKRIESIKNFKSWIS